MFDRCSLCYGRGWISSSDLHTWSMAMALAAHGDEIPEWEKRRGDGVVWRTYAERIRIGNRPGDRVRFASATERNHGVWGVPALEQPRQQIRLTRSMNQHGCVIGEGCYRKLPARKKWR